MTDTEKKSKLGILDANILNLMIEATSDGGDVDLLSTLTVPVQYLKANMVVSEKERSSLEDDIKKRIKEAEKRRAKKEDI